ncbi:MAG TPA: serine/threonine-protein kinase [Actinomycetota bacterium]|nr:serine/threonine-protein kinase [Actinomycetota bacterium]
MEADPLVGREIAGYAIESVLGRGAMGVVYLARQRSPDRRVALKLINPALADEDAFRRRFLRESTAAAAIDHPHILPVYATGETDGLLYIAMRFVEGRDLRAVLRSSEGLDPERVVAIAAQLAGALDAAHARGLVHRDVKPGNILVAHEATADDTDHCYLTDFGVSTWMTSSAGTLTSTGQMIGSVNYAAPDQIEGRRVDGRADQYSLGCVVYECLTGRAPFSGRTAAGTLHAHLHEEPLAPTVLRPVLSPAVDAVLHRALGKRPEGRYGSCREFALDLRSALEGKAIEPTVLRPAEPGPPEPEPPRRRTPWVLAATVMTTAVVVALVAVLMIGRDPEAAAPDGEPGSPSPSVSSAPLIRSGIQVTASSTAPSSTDAAGNVVTYLPANVVDGDVQTAWRTPGDGRGESLTLLFDTPIQVVRIGLIPGYAKTDPESGMNRFEQNRILREVRYVVRGQEPTTQTLRPAPVPQFVRLGATTSRITIEIVETSEPGGLDYTAISEIYVYGVPV